MRRLLAGACAVVAVCILVAIALFGYVKYRYSQIATVKIPGLRQAPPGQPFNVLVVGSDSRATVGAGGTQAFGSSQDVGGQRSDVTIVLHVDPAAETVSILSIPRDLFVPIAGTSGSNRINAAFNNGPEQLVETIQNDFGIPIAHYVLVDFDGFQSLVDALGGINLDFPYPSKDAYSGLHITQAGCQHLDGAQALATARSRHFYYLKDGYWQYDGSSDLGRIRRQHVFLKAVLKTALAEGLTNPIKANSFIGQAVHDVTIDDALGVSDMVSLAREFRSINPAAMVTYTLPNRPVNNYQGFGDVLFPVQPDDQQVVSEFLGQGTPQSPATPQPGSTPPPGQVSVRVLNGTGAAGLATRAAADLRQVGFDVVGTANAPTYSQAPSQIHYAAGQQAAAETLRSAMGGGAQLVQDPGLTGPAVVVVVGTGYSGAHAPSATAPPPAPPAGTAPLGVAPTQDFDPLTC